MTRALGNSARTAYAVGEVTGTTNGGHPEGWPP
jgi:hypothetical protein